MRRISAVAGIATVALAVAVGGCGILKGGNPLTGSPGKGAGAKPAGSSASASPTAQTAVGVVASLLQAGIAQAGRHQWQAADTTFSDVLGVSPRNVYALYNLGLVDQSTGRTAQAAGYYNQAIAANQDYTPALFNLAIIEEKPQPGTALSLYKRIVAVNPKASTAYLRMAYVYARQGNAVEAKKAQAQAIAIDPALGKYSLPGKQ